MLLPFDAFEQLATVAAQEKTTAPSSLKQESTTCLVPSTTAEMNSTYYLLLQL